MNTSSLPRCISKVAATAALLVLTAGSLLAVIDESKTKQVWRLKYGVSDANVNSGAWLAQDADGDGATNGEELAAGTNPFNPSTTIRVTSVVLSGGNAQLTFPTQIGKRYQAERTASLTSPSYSVVGSTVNGTGNSEMISVAHSGTFFYQIRVFDIDTDNDGLADWLEQQANLNPNAAQTTPGTNDIDYVAAQLALPSEVSITATEVFASENGPTQGKFTVSRSQTLLPVTVNLTKTGTATEGVHYTTALPASVNLPVGTGTQVLTVTPTVETPTNLVEGSTSVTLAIEAPAPGDPNYFNVGNGQATVIINDSTATSGTGLRARYYDASSTTYSPTQTNIFNGVPAIDRVDATVNYDWQHGTPNGATITETTGQTNRPDNYSDTFETYLNPTTAGGYFFQLDADDKARVLIDLNLDGDFDLPGEQIVEHGWDTSSTVSPEDTVADNETVGAFKQSASVTLAIPGSPAQRYKMRVEHVETTGDARCRLQWRVPGAGYANIPQGNQFTHTQAATYSFTRTNATSGMAVITLNGHGLVNGNTVVVAFSSGNLFTPNTSDLAGYSGSFTVANAATNTFDVAITGTNLPNTGTGNCFLEDRTLSTTTGVYNKTYANTTFSNTPGRIGVDGAVTTGNNGIWNSGTPDVALINPDTFSIRWTGQVQPQFSEEYTFVVQADDGCVLSINGQVQPMKMVPSTLAGGSTYSYDATNGNLTVTYSGLAAVANSFIAGETVRIEPTSGNLNHAPATSPTYSYNSGTGVMTVDYSNLTNVTAGGFLANDTIELDPTSGNLSSLANTQYTILASPAPTSTTFAVNVGIGLFATGSGNLNINDSRNAVVLAVTPTTFTVNIGAGKYANSSTGNTNVDLLNKTLKDWSSNGNERYVRIPMVGGVRYDIQLDYYENNSAARCILSWYSASQPKQVIPAERLYPSNGTLAPTASIGSTSATALVGGSVSIPISGSNGGSVTVNGSLPAGLSFSGGVLNGTPTTAGDYQIVFTITNANGTSTSVLNLHVVNTGSTIAREYWNGVYANLAAIPTSTAPTGSENLTTSLSKTNAGDDFGARIRGYITAPTTGNYYFWIASSSASELWISNDDEPINAFKRAWVTTGNSTPETWNDAASQKSPWLALEQGKKYYVEILYKASAGADNIAVGWAKPGQPTTAPSEVVPGYALSTYTEPAPSSTPGTLYVATLLAQSGAVTNGVGKSTLRLDETDPANPVAYFTFTHSGLTGALGDWHIHPDPYLGKQGGNAVVLYDGAEPPSSPDGPQPDNNPPTLYSHRWTVAASGPYTKAEVIELLKQGKAYLNLHTAMYPNGEIRGNYTLAAGSRTFTAPPAPPAWTDDSSSDTAAVRFLTQATFGANIADIDALQAMSATSSSGAYPASRYETWIDDQFSKSPTYHLPEVLAREIADVFGPFDVRVVFDSWWKNSMTADDQLRQRVAFALNEIHVVSGQGPLEDNSRGIADFYDTLVENSFGNFRDVLIDTTLTSGMGRYLDMLNNDKPDLAVGRSPNENYAREIKQLFSIGLFRMWPDGTLMLTSKDAPIDTYTQREIVGLSHVFTGWTHGYDGDFRTAINAPADWTRPMREVPARHFTGQKRILNNEVLPGIITLQGQPLDPYATHASTYFNDPVYQALPQDELDAAHDQLFNHPNTGPFICRQLIQRMVTSHPSRDYVYRVVSKFNDNGSGVRGDMQAVIKAILLDYEARSSDLFSGANASPAYGKQREPIMRVANAARAFRQASVGASTYSQTGALNSSGVPYITVTTTNAHKLIGGNSVFLEFTDATTPTAQPAPTTGTYSVLSNPAPTTTTFAIAAGGWMAGTYSQSGTTITVTMNGHNLPGDNANSDPDQVLPGANKGQAYFDFTSGGLNGFGGFDQTVRTVVTSTAYDVPSGVGNSLTPPLVNGNYSGTTFTLTAPDSATRSGNVMIARFAGSYQSTGAGGTITIDTVQNGVGAGTFGGMAEHHLAPGNSVFINFTNSRDTTSGNETSTENDIVYSIVSVPDVNTFTVAARSAANAAMNSDNQAVVFPHVPQPLVRNGTVVMRQSTYVMDNTDADLSQTPLNSPTVFNYFLPDYKFPGTLASQGLTTPEFELTAETTTVRQANFIYNGLFNPGNTNGISSFKSGTNALVLDLSAWMGNATDLGLGAGTQTGQPWTNNANLDSLIDKLDTLLTGGRLDTSARAAIKKFVYRPITSSIAVSNPCEITSTGHGLVDGDSITINGVTGGTFRNTADSANVSINQTFTVTVVDANKFTLNISGGIRCTGATSGISSAHYSPVAYDNAGTPTDTHKRDRLRSILHLILTSPDFTIQR